MVRGITYTKQLIWKVQTKNSRKCSNISVKKYLYKQTVSDVVKLSLKWIFNQFNMILQSFTWQSGILFNFHTFMLRAYIICQKIANSNKIGRLIIIHHDQTFLGNELLPEKTHVRSELGNCEDESVSWKQEVPGGNISSFNSAM